MNFKLPTETEIKQYAWAKLLEVVFPEVWSFVFCCGTSKFLFSEASVNLKWISCCENDKIGKYARITQSGNAWRVTVESKEISRRNDISLNAFPLLFV